MNFDLSDDQKAIVRTVADFVKKELPIERMRKMRDDEIGFSREVWRQMGELGWLGIALPAEAGGFGGRFVDAALVLEQLGTTLVSEPYPESAVVAARAVLHGAREDQREAILGPLCAGEEVLALAYLEEGMRYDPWRVKTRAEKRDGGFHLVGEKRWVLAGHAADRLVVSARTAGNDGERGGISLFVVAAGDAGVERKTVKTMDGRKAAMIRFDCQLAADRLLGEEGEGLAALERALDDGAAAACAEGNGAMKASLSMTIEYLKTREQFGVKIGTFQALQHRAVDMFVETELAKSTSILAAIRVDEPDADERRRAVSAAKAQLSIAGKLVTQQATQLHGGIGVTDEHDIGLYFKRMHALAVLYGDEQHHVDRYASLPSFVAGL
jgi:alkylation response protein AidB-like acyl-CoA dehydrogenase